MSIKYGFAAYPSTVEHAEILGYVEDESGMFFSRDFGWSFELGGEIYFVFGDMFCRDRGGEVNGLVNDILAVVEETKRLLKTR